MTSRRILQVLFALATVNFFAFFFECIYLGGSAGNGRIVNGHYFLGEHGRFTEVTKAVYDFSHFHMVTLFITHPLGLLAALLLNRNVGQQMQNHLAPKKL